MTRRGHRQPGEGGRAGPAGAGGQDAVRRRERFRGRSVLVEADRIVPRQKDGEVIDDGRSLNAHIEPGALVVRVPQPVAKAANQVRSLR
jgi:hypothetical protein